MRRRRIVLAATTALVATALASPAHAQVAWQPCTDGAFGAFECSRARVPLDRSGRVPGTVDLFLRRLPAPSNPNRTALVFLSGGPGQAATGSALEVAEALATGLHDRDLLIFDQRGTGASGALECNAVRQDLTTRATAESCARELGARRGLFRTVDSVADLEDLRVAAGYEKLALYGVSYGTKVALAYAERHPDRVERLVLDSTVTPEGPDALRRTSFAASSRILTGLCASGHCRGITPDPVADVRALMRRDTIRGRYVNPAGKRRRGQLSPASLYDLLEAGDLNPVWRAFLPGAMRSAALGDEAPLLRLASSIFQTDGQRAAQVPGDDVNRALYLATVCEEITFPWQRGAGADARLRQAQDALEDVPASTFAPFDRATVARSSLLPLCFGWPNAAPAPAAPGPLPRVPSLVLTGETDVRTPAEDADAIAARLGATAVHVPHTGHSVLGNDFSGCARGAVAAFFRDGSTPACPPGIEPLALPVRRAPRALREVPVARSYKGRVGRTLNAVAFTQQDALVAALGAQLEGRNRIAGIRRGSIVISPLGVALRRVSLVPGVRVTGLFPQSGGEARVRITGRAAARGRLTIDEEGRATGVLGGKRIDAAPRASAAAAAATRGPGEPERAAPFPSLIVE